MDWDQIVERNRERLLAALAPLLAVLGFDLRRRLEMPRHFYRSWLILLRPAESAVRRLIVMAARGIVVKLGAARGFPAGLALKLRLAAKAADEERVPAFGLIDPLKHFAPADFEWSKEWGKDWGKEQVIPRISVPGLFDPVFPEPAPVPSRDDTIDTAALVRRIAALKSALDGVNDTQNKAEALTDAYQRGEVTDVAKVMLARQEAGVAFEATLQVRNRLLSAYQDIMRMGV